MRSLNISAWSIRNPIPPIVLVLGLLFAGLVAYNRLPINQLPNIEFPVYTVTVVQAGASPSELETQVTRRIEGALSGIDGVKRVTSNITQGVSTTVVELRIGASLVTAIDDTRDAMTRIRADLPADIDEPRIERQDGAAEPIAYYAIEGEGKTPEDLSYFIDDVVTRQLQAVSGVSQIRRTGGVDREVRVELDPERLSAYGLSADDVSRQLRGINADLPGGRAELGGQAQSIRTVGAATTVIGLSEARILAAGGRSVRLTDLGTVRDTGGELASMSRFNGQPAVTFLVQRAKGSSEVHVFDRMAAAIKDIEAAHPGITFQLIGTPVNFVKGMHKSSMAALIEGALLAVLVVFLILRDWRATLIAAVAIPLATIPTFAAMEPLGFTLNMITLIALSLVAGVLVDDAIVEVENITRHIRMGKSPYEAALEAADEIGLAVVATSATIIAVFLPVSFMSGVNGQFFKEFGITVAVAVFFSLIVARLITPMMAAYFLKGGHEEPPPGWLTLTYRDVLSWAIRRPFAAAVMGLAVFVVSLLPVVFNLVPFTFLPRLDNGTVQVDVELPPGTPLLEADRKLQAMVAEISKTPEVASIFTSLQGADGAASSGTIYVTLTEREERGRGSYAIQQEMRPLLGQFADVRTSFLNFQGGGRGADVTLQFVGDDPVAVAAAADALVEQMKGLPDLVDVKSSAALRRPELQIIPRPLDAARLGVSAADLAAATRIATGGDVDQNLARFNLPDRQVPIRVVLRSDQRADLATLQALPVASRFGGTVRLDDVADVKFALGEAVIERRDRQRAVTVSANVGTDRQPMEMAQEVTKLPAANNLPAGVRLVAAGSTEEGAETVGAFMTALGWGVLMIYAVLVLLFRDFLQPLTIMTALPLSVGGAFVGLLLANQPLSLFVFIGFIMLAGIVTKNSILLVDFAIERMREGVSRNQALLEAGMKRARPIVMTTIAMSAGMIPAAAGLGVDGALRQGMGVAVIGGLILSTLLSLIFVPAVYVLVDRLESLITPYLGRLTTRAPATPHAAE